MENRLIRLILLGTVAIIWIYQSAFSQEVYQELISGERDRRQLYQINDWIGYINMRHITWITSDKRFVYFATFGGGIWRYDKIKEKWSYPFTVCNGLPDNRILYIGYDPNQNILIAVTPNDTAFFDYGQQIWLTEKRDGALPYQVVVNEKLNAGSDNIMRFIQGYSEQFGLLSFDNPDYRYLLGGKIQDNNLREFVISGFFRDDYNHIFFAIEGLGLAYGYATDSDFHIMEGGISDISPRSFYFSPEEIWIGGFGRFEDTDGITRWRNDNTFIIYNDRFIPELYSDQVNYITGNDSLIAFGTQNGLAIYHSYKNMWDSYTGADGLMGDEILSLFFDESGLWIGTRRGLNFMELRRRRIQKIQTEAFRNQKIYDFTGNTYRVYLASSLGVFEKDTIGQQWKQLDLNLPFPEVEITTIAIRGNELWVGGEYGLAHVNLKTGESQFFREVNQKVPPRYYDIVFYENGVFIGTDNGLLRYDKRNNKWQLYTIRDGLLNNQVFRLHTENGDLWMVTPEGICQFRYKRVIR